MLEPASTREGECALLAGGVAQYGADRLALAGIGHLHGPAFKKRRSAQ